MIKKNRRKKKPRYLGWGVREGGGLKDLQSLLGVGWGLAGKPFPARKGDEENPEGGGQKQRT